MRKILIGILISCMAVLSACFSSYSGGSGGNANEVQIGGFVGGTEGLRYRLTDGAPPPNIVDQKMTPFSFMLNLENAGEAKIGSGTENPLVLVRLLGFRHVDFGLTEETAVKVLDQSLEPARRNFDGSITPGEITAVVFDNLAYQQNIFDSITLTLRAELCYDYESVATTKFCMKSDLLENIQDSSICNLRGLRPVGNAGSPIHITSVQQAPISFDTIQLNMNIEHVGRGIYFARSSYTDNYKPCEFTDLNRDMYRMEVTVEPLQQGTYEVTCNRLDQTTANGGVRGELRSVDNAPLSLTCFVKRISQTQVRLYEDIMNVKIKYRYGEFVEVPILVQGNP